MRMRSLINIAVWGIFLSNGGDLPRAQSDETQHGKNLVDAAKTAGVQHFVWSSLEAMKTIRCPHMDGKAAGECFITYLLTTASYWLSFNLTLVASYLEVSGLPFTNIHPSFFYEVSNLLCYRLMMRALFDACIVSL